MQATGDRYIKQLQVDYVLFLAAIVITSHALVAVHSFVCFVSILLVLLALLWCDSFATRGWLPSLL